MMNADFISLDQMMAAVASRCAQENDSFRSRGWYITAVRDCLRELAYITLFDKKHFVASIPETLVITLPGDYADIAYLYLFDGDKCDFTNQRNLYWHVGMDRHGGGNYFAENKGYNHDDPIMEDSLSNWNWNYSEVHSYNIQNGKLMLSSSCLHFEKVYVGYAGLGHTKGVEPEIPSMLRPAVEDYVTIRAFQYLSARQPGGQFRGLANDAYKMYHEPFIGSKAQARKLVRRLHSKMLRDYAKYETTFGQRF